MGCVVYVHVCVRYYRFKFYCLSLTLTSLTHTHTHTHTLSLSLSLSVFILFFPVLFVFGWLPQLDTFIIYFCEQIDMNIFGGTAMTGLICALYSVGRSVLACLALLPLGYAAFYTLKLKDVRVIIIFRCRSRV